MSHPLSYCFCENCRKEFSKYSGVPIDEIATMEPKQIIKNYKSKWIDFRVWQNTMIIDKISRKLHQYYPDIKFILFCGYENKNKRVRTRYGIDWPSILALPYVDGVQVGGGMPGTPSKIMELRKLASKNGKTFLSMAASPIGGWGGGSEGRNWGPDYQRARYIHDIVSGSGGIYIYWWGTLDGKCLKAFEEASILAAKYGDTMLNGKHTSTPIGETENFHLIIAEDPKGKLICIANVNTLRFEDKILSPSKVIEFFPSKGKILNVLTGNEESLASIEKRISKIFKVGDVCLWYIPQEKKDL
jgi:hypothetical protein